MNNGSKAKIFLASAFMFLLGLCYISEEEPQASSIILYSEDEWLSDSNEEIDLRDLKGRGGRGSKGRGRGGSGSSSSCRSDPYKKCNSISAKTGAIIAGVLGGLLVCGAICCCIHKVSSKGGKTDY